MKISELTQIPQLRRDIKIPIAIAGQNMHVSLGQILDALSASVVLFDDVMEPESGATYASGSTDTPLPIVFDKDTKKFYAMAQLATSVSGIMVRTTTLYTQWGGSEMFYDGDSVRTDCLFISTDGRLYHFNGTDLISAGLTDAQAKQLSLLTAIEMPSDEAMEALIESGDAVEGQIYYTTEE